MADESDRWDLPFIVSGQAQKEVTHNEALARIDALLHPVVEAVGLVAPPVAPLPGQGWIIGAGATGDWSGHDGALALSSENGWIFIAPREGMTVFDRATALSVRRGATYWRAGELNARRLLIDGVGVIGAQQPAIALPTAGAFIDQEARIAINDIVTALREHGLIAH